MPLSGGVYADDAELEEGEIAESVSPFPLKWKAAAQAGASSGASSLQQWAGANAVANAAHAMHSPPPERRRGRARSSSSSSSSTSSTSSTSSSSMRRQRRRHRRREEKRRRVEPHGAPFATPRRKHSSDARAERSTLATGSSGPASRKHPPPPGGAERWDPRADRPAKALCSVDVEAELAPAEDAAPKQSIGDAARARFSTERRALRQFMADGGEEAFGESRGGARQACVALAAAERAGLPLCRPMAAEESERSFITASSARRRALRTPCRRPAPTPVPRLKLARGRRRLRRCSR